MLTSTTPLVLIAAASLAAAGNIYVDNKCTDPVYVQTYDGTESPPASANPPTYGGAPTAYDPTEIAPGVCPGWVHPTNPAVEPPVPNLISFSFKKDLSDPLSFSYSPNADSNTFFYSFINDSPFGFEAKGYEVLTNGGHDAVTCPAVTDGATCPNARNGVADMDPAKVFTVPLDSVPTGPDFTIRLCQFDGQP
ncbi:MAG: hypothetical protein Q9162_001608 [Coniocarpon cinnabarinum]